MDTKFHNLKLLCIIYPTDVRIVNTCFNCRNGSTIIDFELEKRIPESENTDSSANDTAMEFQTAIQNKVVNDAASGSLFAGATVDKIVAVVQEGCTQLLAYHMLFHFHHKLIQLIFEILIDKYFIYTNCKCYAHNLKFTTNTYIEDRETGCICI